MLKKLIPDRRRRSFLAKAVILPFLLGSLAAWLLSLVTSPLNATVDFKTAIPVKDGVAFGPHKAFTFELFRNGIFEIPGDGIAFQVSESYRDSAIIRSTRPLPDTYVVRVEFGEVNYDVEALQQLENDPEYSEGPLNENGVYFLAITDTLPDTHHINSWWHEHRKLVIDTDNNVWGTGMPYPVFMVYFDSHNELVSYNESSGKWERAWKKAYTYDKTEFYAAEIEKTATEYILRLYDNTGKLLRTAGVEREKVWHADSSYPEYLVTGDPHENYYQGTFKLRKISIRET